MFWVVPNNPIAAVTPANKALLRRFLNNKSKVTSTGTLEDRDRHYYPKMNISVDLPRRFKSAVFKLKYQHNHFTWPQHHEVLCIKCKPLQPQHVFGFFLSWLFHFVCKLMSPDTFIPSRASTTNTFRNGLWLQLHLIWRRRSTWQNVSSDVITLSNQNLISAPLEK